MIRVTTSTYLTTSRLIRLGVALFKFTIAALEKAKARTDGRWRRIPFETGEVGLWWGVNCRCEHTDGLNAYFWEGTPMEVNAMFDNSIEAATNDWLRCRPVWER